MAKVKLVVLRDMWLEDGRHREGAVIERDTEEAFDLIEGGLARRLKDEDEVKRRDEAGNEEVVKAAGEPVKKRRGRRKKNADL